MSEPTRLFLKALLEWIVAESEKAGEESRKSGGDNFSFHVGIRRGFTRVADRILYLIGEDATQWEGVDNEPICDVKGRELRQSVISPKTDHLEVTWDSEASND